LTLDSFNAFHLLDRMFFVTAIDCKKCFCVAAWRHKLLESV